MIDDAILRTQVVERIHMAPGLVVLVVTGGGSRAISALLEVPGASQTVLEATVPYNTAALVQYLGAEPEQFCSEHTVRLMAMAAYERARRYASDASVPVAGVACTASLVSNRPKRGEHRVHIGLQTASETRTWSLVLHKGSSSRLEEEDIAACLALNAVARFKGLPDALDICLFDHEAVVEAGEIAPSEWQRLLAGEIASIAPNENAKPQAVFPGAFHPLHDGHREMAAIAARRLNVLVAFEISVANVDKPPLDFLEMRRRAEQFAGEPLWFTRAPTFAEKAPIFPGATFIVGADTIRRIAEPRYYGNDAAARDRAIETIAAAGCRFLIFPRRSGTLVETLSEMLLPPALRALCDEVPAAEFLRDVSSTELRRAADDQTDAK